MRCHEYEMSQLQDVLGIWPMHMLCLLRLVPGTYSFEHFNLNINRVFSEQRDYEYSETCL